MRGFVINLDSRPDRLEAFSKQNLPFPVERFPAISDPDGNWGCTKSHLALLRGLRERDEPLPFIVFEDDCKFVQPWSAVEAAMPELPKDWDILCLGSLLTAPVKRVSPHLFRWRRGWSTHAMVYGSHRVVDFIVENHNLRIMDRFIKNTVQEKFNCFLTSPLVAVQSNSKSNIRLRKHTRYEQIIAQAHRKFAI